MARPDATNFQFDGLFNIPEVNRDASALAVHADTGHLWTITDDKIRLVEFTGRGQFIRAVKLAGFEDTEGLCHVDGDRFLVAEEKQLRITLIEVPPGTEKIKADGPSIELDIKAKKNKGLEGISYDAATDTLFAVREGNPPGVFRIRPFLSGKSGQTTELPLDLDDFDDLSDIFFDATVGWLWLLSHESQVAAAFDADGRRVVEVRLKKGCHGLPEDVEQAEGIVRNRKGTLYICSEPNRVYRFCPSQ